MKPIKFIVSKALVVAALFAGLMVAPAITSAAAFGISPPWVQYDYLKPGTSYSQIITLSTNDPKQEMLVDTSMTGDAELVKWLRIENVNNLTMPVGKQQVPVKIWITVPPEAAVQKYHAAINVTVHPKEAYGSPSFALGGVIDVDVAVTDKDYTDFLVRSVAVQPVQNFLSVGLVVENKGNVDLTAMKVVAEIMDQRDEKVLFTVTQDKLDIPIPAYTTQSTRITLPLNTQIDPGNYWTRIRVLNGKKEVYALKSSLEVKAPFISTSSLKTVVQVARPGEGENVHGSASVRTSVTVVSPYRSLFYVASIVGLLLLLTLVYFGFLRKKRKW